MLYTNPEGSLPTDGEEGPELTDLPDVFRFILDGGALDGETQEVDWNGEGVPQFAWRPVRPIPSDDDFFENVWRQFREDDGVPVD